jgi:hypothetical protein
MGAYEFRLFPDAGNIIYVKETATGTGRGNSWDNATSYLYFAIHTQGVQKVFAATGNYNVGDNSFMMKNGVEIYGGFNPVNTTTDWATRTLPNKGMGDGSILNGQNTRPVIYNGFTSGTALNNTAVLDGFTIMNGNGISGAGIYNYYASPTLRNLVIRNNTAGTAGGGIYNNLQSAIRLSNSVIKDNSAQYGGGVYNNNSTSVLTNVSISGNSATLAATGAGGGGIFNQNATPVLTNVLIASNSSNSKGGGLRNLSGNPLFTNVTVANNTATNSTSSALDIAGGTPELNNSIVYGTVSGTYNAQYSLIEGNMNTTNGNLDATGLMVTDIFTGVSNSDYTLKSGSPALNAGNSLLNVSATDLAGNTRIYGSAIDLGAFEFDPNTTLPMKLLSFTAQKQNQNALLQWTTAEEQNCKGYEVERSGDSKTWSKMGFVNSLSMNGNSIQDLNYTFTDNAPLQGKNFYRLKQIDFDGRYEYGPVRMVTFDVVNNICIYPNPAKESVNITGLQGGETVVMFDISGKVLKELKSNSTDMLIPLQDLVAGAYQVLIISESKEVMMFKIVKGE